jgi:hypothetical protein
MRLAWMLQAPTRATLAGTAYQVYPLRLGTLASLESLALANWTPPPLPNGRDLTDPAVRREWADACAETEEPAPAWGTPDCAAVAFGSIPGRALMIADALRVDYVEAKRLAEAFDADDWSTFDRLAFADDPQMKPYRELDRLLGIPEFRPGGTAWSEAVAQVATELGVAPHTLADWTIGEFNALRSGGKRPSPWGDYSDETGPDGRLIDPEGWEYYSAEVAPRRGKFWAEFPSEPEPADG